MAWFVWVRRGKAGSGRARHGAARLGKTRFFMPKKRQPKEIWRETRIKVLERDNYKCVREVCGASLTARTAHIDHIQSGKLGTNEIRNLRALCRRCHVLRSDFRHRGMIANALRDGIIPPNWRELVWE